MLARWEMITSSRVWTRVIWVYFLPCEPLSNISHITLGKNFLLFECCLDFYNWFRVFLNSWIRKWHLFLSIRSGFFARLFEKNQIFWQNRLHFCGIISWFLSTHIILNVFKRKCFANNIYWLPDRNIDYCELNGWHWQR